jgi:hypothetical protein
MPPIPSLNSPPSPASPPSLATRDEKLAYYDAALAAAATNPAKYDEVALRLNGFNKGDIQRLTTRLTIEQARGTRAATERVLRGWPEQQTILDGIDAGTVQKGVHLRPLGSSIWAAYSPVKYGTATADDVWDRVGGIVARDYHTFKSTCATRLSYAFNYGGYPIRDSKPGWIFVNDPKVTYKGTSGDNKRYIISAPFLVKWLRSQWGPPDATLRTVRGKDESPGDADKLRASLRPDQVAVFSGEEHAGLIMHGYDDHYIYQSLKMMPAYAWKLG